MARGSNKSLALLMQVIHVWLAQMLLLEPGKKKKKRLPQLTLIPGHVVGTQCQEGLTDYLFLCKTHTKHMKQHIASSIYSFEQSHSGL